MASIEIKGIPVLFPFEPYDLQKAYMEKVIECLQNESNAVLESPTGTGKTLSLLCASLAWHTVKKAQFQSEILAKFGDLTPDDQFMQSLKDSMENKLGSSGRKFLKMPTIIYASRTHSQLAQAMSELKKSAYSHVKATILGSREQLCIHPDVIKEPDIFAKLHLCRSKVESKSCRYHNQIDRMKNNAVILDLNVVDIEDIVTYGKKYSFCPYYMVRELTEQADIIFMPYNYLLDPRIRKGIGVDLTNNIVILDEAHNIGKICEDSASVAFTSADLTLCIAEVTDVMKSMTATVEFSDTPPDFTADDLCVLKQVLLDFEKTIDGLELINNIESGGSTFPGDYIFEIFNKAGINYTNYGTLSNLINKIIQFLTVSANDGPFQRKGNGLELFSFLLSLAYAIPSPDMKEKIKKCYTIYLEEEQPKTNSRNNWLSRATSSHKNGGRTLNFWCFSPGFGMGMLLGTGVKSIILTSGTLAPLKPFISELELPIKVELENPHIIKENQICVKILEKGPDGKELNSSYKNRDNPEYISSLGRTILNITRMVPNGILIFFPSYPLMEKCAQHWQETGIWSHIYGLKAIFVEPRRKEAFDTAMAEYYARVANPQFKGAIFMGVCRGKISEGLDFADSNGRAVLITGLPYAPLKDPKVILKRRYLDTCKQENKEMISGDDWYTLEATRAVNQAIGRIIRHRHDYGSIVLLDSRFTSFRIKSQLSLWLRDRIKVIKNFGEVVKDLKEFYRYTEKNLPSPNSSRSLPQTKETECSTSTNCNTKHQGFFNFSTNSVVSSIPNGNSNGLVTIYDRKKKGSKRKRITICSNDGLSNGSNGVSTDSQEYMALVKKSLTSEQCDMFINALKFYKEKDDFEEFTKKLNEIFLCQYNIRYLIQGLQPYIKEWHKEMFNNYWEKMR